MAEWNENARVKPAASHYKPDGTVDLDQPIGDEFDEVLDPLNDLLTGRNRSLSADRHGSFETEDDPIQTARERQKMERDVRLFMKNLAEQLRPVLYGQGIRVESVTRNANYDFTVWAVAGGVRVDVNLSLDDALQFTEQQAREPFLDLCGKVVTKVLAAREALRVAGRLG